MDPSLHFASIDPGIDIQNYHDRGSDIFAQGDVQPMEQRDDERSYMSGITIDQRLEELEWSREYVHEALELLSSKLEISMATEIQKDIEKHSSTIVAAYTEMVDMTIFRARKWRMKRIDDEAMTRQYCRVIDYAILCSAAVADRLSYFYGLIHS